MARFLTRSQLARVTPVLGHHYRSSLGLFSTTPNMKIPLFENPNKFLRTEEQNEKHRKVKQLAKEVVILSCESTSNGGVCDVYVLGVTHYSPESCREVQAITSYLKPQLLFLELCKSRSFHSLPFEPKPNEYKVQFQSPRTSRDIIKDLMGKRIDIYKAYEEWSAAWRFKKNPDELEAAKKRAMNSEFTVAYQEAVKYGIMVVLGDRPIEVMTKRLSRKLAIWQKSLFFQILGKGFDEHTVWEVLVDERDKYMAHQLLEVARKNCSIVAIVGSAHLEGVKKYWKQPIKVEDLMSIPPSILPSKFYLICLICHGVVTGIAIIAFWTWSQNFII